MNDAELDREEPELDETETPEEKARFEKLFNRHMLLVSIGYVLIGLASTGAGLKMIYDGIVKFNDTSFVLIPIGIVLVAVGFFLIFKVATIFYGHSKGPGLHP